MSQDPETLYDTAQRMVGEGKLAAAEVLLRQAVDLATDPNLYLAGLGTLLGLQEGHTEESVEILKEQLEHFPDNPTLLVAYGMTMGATGDVDQAEEAFRKAVDKNPNHPQALNSLAQVVLAKGDVEQAEKMACKAFALAPDHADFALMAHAILDAQGKVDLAYEVAAVGATYNPTDMDLVQKAVEGALARDDADRAWDILKESDEQVSWVIGWKATLLDLQGQGEKADEMLQAGRRQHSRNPNFLLLESSIYQRRGEVPRALAVVDELLAVDPGNAAALQLKTELGSATPVPARPARAEQVREPARLEQIEAYYRGKNYEDAYAVCATLLQTDDAPDLAFMYATLSLAAMDHAEECMSFLEMLPDELVGRALREVEKHGAGTAAEEQLSAVLGELLGEAPAQAEPAPPEEPSEPQAPKTYIPTGGPDFSGFFAVKDIEDPEIEEDDDDGEYEDEDYELVGEDDDEEYEWVEVDDDEEE